MRKNLSHRFVPSFFALLFTFILSACAGPATPFGALNSLKKPEIQIAQKTPIKSLPIFAKTSEIYTAIRRKATLPIIRFSPEKQVLHNRINLSILIENLGESYNLDDLQVRYNGWDVTTPLLKQAKVRLGSGTLSIDLKDFRLNAKLGQKIEVQMSHEASRLMGSANLEEPSCHPFQVGDFGNVGDFRFQPRLLRYIKDTSKKYMFNPLMFTGLIAQESGFNPNAISWAKAVGLTQMTPAADRTIFKDSQTWPRNRSISSYPYPIVKSLIMSGKLNEKKDWRLNPFYSVKGGLLYINWVREYWSKKEHKALLNKVLGKSDMLLGQVILASYNSGPARVKYSIEKYGINWLSSPKLGAAQEYVAKITSYCEYFKNERDEL